MAFPHSSLLRSLAVCAVLLGGGATTASSAELPPEAAAYLNANCADCHSGAEAEGGLDLTALGSDLADPRLASRWVRIHDRVRAGEMPPPDSAGAPKAESQEFARLVGSWITEDQLARQREEGRVRGRRLTAVQLERTLQDLLGIDIPLAEGLPDDPRTAGFTTVAEGQSISHFQLEQHLGVVDAALEEAWTRAIRGDDVWKKDLSAKDLSRTRPRTREPELIDDCAVVWSSKLAFYGRIPATEAKKDGWYRFTIRASSLKDDGEGVWTTVRSGQCVSSAPLMRSIGTFQTGKDAKEVTFEAWMPDEHMLEIRPGDATLKMARFEGGQSAIGEGGAQDVPGIAIQSATMERFHRGPDAAALRELLFDDLKIKRADGKPRLVSDDPQHDAERLLARFARRAFRLPVTAAELAPYLAAVRASLESGDGLLEALRIGYRTLLCSPRFLYFDETPGPLDDHAIASRLSYFLWGTMPDEKLTELAEAGRLRDKAVLRAEVDRMLADPRGTRLVPDFADQWLDLADIEATDPDPRLYRDFDLIVQHSMVDETRAFLSTMLSENLGVSHLIDADFTFLNERLARYYEIDGVEGDELRRVSLKPEDRRGGILTQGAILKVTANGSTTSPVIRGVWICERLLGEHVPPPPESVPAIEPDVRGTTTIRDMLAKHRSNDDCASCHVKIDPPGFALENFDPSGRWRDRYTVVRDGGRQRGEKVDPSYVTADGRPFDDLDEFRAIVLEDPARLARNVAEKMITYGTGAVPTFADRAAVEQIAASTQASNHGFRSLLHAVVTSEVFLSK